MIEFVLVTEIVFDCVSDIDRSVFDWNAGNFRAVVIVVDEGVCNDMAGVDDVTFGLLRVLFGCNHCCLLPLIEDKKSYVNNFNANYL
jgi:hypothetical protein